ncbi:hypothetical protein [Streptomyces bobili]|uniref:hypothetical protein n=1 Tax=Streptomyces bobili TaxID=67280 RepID=UPI003795023F
MARFLALTDEKGNLVRISAAKPGRSSEITVARHNKITGHLREAGLGALADLGFVGLHDDPDDPVIITGRQATRNHRFTGAIRPRRRPAWPAPGRRRRWPRRFSPSPQGPGAPGSLDYGGAAAGAGEEHISMDRRSSPAGHHEDRAQAGAADPKGVTAKTQDDFPVTMDAAL